MPEFLKPSIIQRFRPIIEILENDRLYLEVRAIASPEPKVKIQSKFINFFL